jgi:glycine cleavage system aminomethyltransferase T
MSDPVMRSSVHRLHADLGARFVRDGPWEVPADYGDPSSESRALAGTVGVCDVTARGKVDLRGDIAPLLPRVVRASEGVERGWTMPLEPAPSESRPGVLARIGDDWALLSCRPTGLEAVLAKLEEPAGGGAVMVTDVSSHYAVFGLSGPRTFDLLRRLTGFDVGALAPGACASTRAMEVGAILVHRDAQGASPVVEVWVGSELGRYAWETIAAEGAPLGIAPVGREALERQGWW